MEIEIIYYLTLTILIYVSLQSLEMGRFKEMSVFHLELLPRQNLREDLILIPICKQSMLKI
jgi:hypothetical protein